MVSDTLVKTDGSSSTTLYPAASRPSCMSTTPTESHDTTTYNVNRAALTSPKPSISTAQWRRDCPSLTLSFRRHPRLQPDDRRQRQQQGHHAVRLAGQKTNVDQVDPDVDVTTDKYNTSGNAAAGDRAEHRHRHDHDDELQRHRCSRRSTSPMPTAPRNRSSIASTGVLTSDINHQDRRLLVEHRLYVGRENETVRHQRRRFPRPPPPTTSRTRPTSPRPSTARRQAP